MKRPLEPTISESRRTSEVAANELSEPSSAAVVNTNLLDFLALGHRGESEYALPKEDIDRKVGRFFDRIGSPLLTDLELEFDG